MSPIKGVSELRRIPRLGKVRLGVKIEPPGGNPYPHAVDYFVSPPEVQAVFGEKPKELRIMFPVEDEEKFAQQWYRAYSRTRGLICKGDGVEADRLIDRATGDLATRDSKDVERREMTCPGPNCPEFQRKQCRRVMNLMFLLPEVPGLGVWQLDTSSFYSMVNINSGIELVRELCGRIAMVPLTLSLGPMEVTPEGGPKKTVHVLHLTSQATLMDIQKAAALPPARVLLPPPASPEEEETPDDLFPKEVLEQAEAAPEPIGVATPIAPAAPAPQPPPPPPDPRQEGWRIAQELVKKLGLKDSAVRAWWQPKGVTLALADFDRTSPPEGVTDAHLSAFVDALQAGKQARTV